MPTSPGAPSGTESPAKAAAPAPAGTDPKPGAAAAPAAAADAAAPSATAPAAAAAPAGVSREDFDAFQRAFNERWEERERSFNETLRVALAAARPAATPDAEPAIDDVSDAEIDAAIAEGRPVSPLIRKAAAAGAERLLRPERKALRAELDQLRAVGLGNISALAESAITALPYYTDYKREIDAAVAELPDHMRANVAARRECYNLVIGRHTPELVEKARQESLRAGRDTATETGTQGGATGREVGGTTAQPNAREILGESAYVAAIENGGLETTAKMFGYATVDDWLTSRQKYNEGLTHAHPATHQ
jgi:hypothetical protein